MLASLPQSELARYGSRYVQPEPTLPGIEPTRPTWRQFFKALLKGEYKAAGVRIFGGDPESARISLGRILDNAKSRHADWDWIDQILESFPKGTAREMAERHFVAFVCARYGFAMPDRLPDPEATREELENVKRTLDDVRVALESVTKAVGHIEGRIK